MTDHIVRGSDGKPVFIGREARPPRYGKEGASSLSCPVCGKECDYLVGENSPDGGRQGCEGCWRPGRGMEGGENHGQKSTEANPEKDPKKMVFE